MLFVDMRDDRSENVHYDYESYPIYIRRALLSSYANYEAPPHWHDDLECIVILQGEMQYNINGETVTIKQNEGIFVNARQLHYGFSESKKDCAFLCILIHPLLLCSSRAFEQDFVLPLLQNPNVPYKCLSPAVPWQEEILRDLQSMYAAKSHDYPVPEITALIYNIWQLLFCHTKAPAPAQVQSSDFTTLKNMIGFIQKSYKEKITLAQIAKSGAVGESKCCKLFEKHLGTTPNAYLIRYRLHQSTWYLENTDLPMTQIAHGVGFSGSSYYAEAFRKRYGTSPRAYRKANAANTHQK